MCFLWQIAIYMIGRDTSTTPTTILNSRDKYTLLNDKVQPRNQAS